MKQYKFVRVKYDGCSNLYVFKKDKEKISPRKVIEDMAEQGYRFVEHLPVRRGAYGSLQEYDLVFEKDI